MRTVISTILLSGAALLAAGVTPAAVEAQRTGSGARGTVGTARTWVGDAARPAVGQPGRASGWVRDPWRGSADWRSDFRFRYQDPRYRAPARRTHYDYAPDYAPLYYPPLTYYSPAVVYLPPTTTREVYVETAMVRPRTIVLPAPAGAPALETCAVVTVLEPNHRGYWKELRLPAAGARNADELQRILDARIEEGEPFTVRDADGATLDIPAGAGLDRVIVDRCR